MYQVDLRMEFLVYSLPENCMIYNLLESTSVSLSSEILIFYPIGHWVIFLYVCILYKAQIMFKMFEFHYMGTYMGIYY